MSTSFDGKSEKLIRLVQQHPELYDHQHSKYQDASYKSKVWNMIGSLMEEDGLACKNRWCNIRDQYRKSVKKRLSNRGKKTPKYKFADELSFLEEVADPVEEPTQNSNHEVASDELSMNSETIKMELSAADSGTSDFRQSDTYDDVISDVIGSSAAPTTTRIIRRIKRPALKNATSSTTEANSSRMVKILQQQLEEARNPAPVDAFLMGLAPALKNLHPVYWHQAKAEIFAIVQKYELKMLTEQPPT